MPAAEPHFVLLTGLGADERLFNAQRAAFPGLVTPRWIAPWPREGLAEYAERFAAEIPISRPLVLGGCSLGGMVAYEMAHVLRPDALVLIASAVTATRFHCTCGHWPALPGPCQHSATRWESE